MKKENFYRITTFVLLLLNSATLVYLYLGHQGPPGAAPPRKTNDFIIKQLNLNNDQQKQFDTLRSEHQQALRQIREEDKRLQDVYFDLLKTGTQQRSSVDSITNLIAMQRKATQLALFDHFIKLRSICTPEQQQKLNSIIDEIARRISSGPGEGGPPPPHP
jgi:Spy/CpxP family protein refolding chaperone